MCGPDCAVVDDLQSLMGLVIERGYWDSDYNNSTWSLAIMDTIDFSKNWSLFLGARLDDFDYYNDVVSTDRNTGKNRVYTQRRVYLNW